MINWDQARWIWQGKSEGVNAYVEFRKVFVLAGGVRRAELRIAADSDFEVWVNGDLIGWNQYQSWPWDKCYNTYKVKGLSQGKHVIAVRVYYRGENFFTYAKGRAGLICQLASETGEVLAATEGSWRCRASKSYHSGEAAKVTTQLGYTIHYDARGEDGWQAAGYRDNGWEKAVELGGATEGFWKVMRERPMALLEEKAVRGAALQSCGYFKRTKSKGSAAEMVMSDALRYVKPAALFDWQDERSMKFEERKRIVLQGRAKQGLVSRITKAEGVYLIFDVGAQEAGLLELDIEAPAGTMVDIAHGEHLDDMRVRAAVGGRNFADRYICGKGRRVWVQRYRRLGGRYLQVHLSGTAGKAVIYQCSLRPTDYPFEMKGAFACNDSLLNQVWQTGRRTMQLCAHEHYEDCPWREQSLYGCDSRLQALYGHYSFGDYKFTAASWELLGGHLREDDLEEITAPTFAGLTIPGFSLHWISAVWELYWHSGDKKVLEKHYGTICRILDRMLTRLNKEGVVETSTEPGHWHFYEWTEGLAGDCGKACAGKRPDKRMDAVFNLLLLNSLRATHAMSEVLGDSWGEAYGQAHRRIVKSFHKVFWDAKRGAYASYKRGATRWHYAQLTEALAILEGVGSAAVTKDLREKLTADETLVKAEYSSKLFVYEALLGDGERYGAWVLEDIRRCFGRMIYAGATSLWEHFDGADAFGFAGSLCHAWSSVLNYVGGARILGIRPVRAGFEQFEFAPVTGGLAEAQGAVPTSKGIIHVQWRDNGKEIRAKIRYPKGLTMKVKGPAGRRVILE